MNRNYLTIVVGGILLAIFAVLLFCFQVRKNETAFLTTFGAASTEKFPPGLHFKWPWPIQKVHKFDARVQNFESKFEEALTKEEGKPILVAIYLGWQITDPRQFSSSFGGSINLATNNLESLVGSIRSAVVGKHPFSHFISADPKELQFTQIEKDMSDEVQRQLEANAYGIKVSFLHIKRLGLPEQITSKVFERMKEERQRLVAKYQSEGEGRAIEIRAAATRNRDETISTAEAEATRIRGDADNKATEAYTTMEKYPSLATFLQKLNSMELILKDKTTLILDPRTPPFDLLLRGTNNLPVLK